MSSKRILVVDDEASIRTLYAQELGDEGYEVETVASAEEATRVLERQRPDLLILDIELPGKNGLTYLREVMGEHRDMPVLISSAYHSYKDDFASWSAEAYVVKSSDLDPLKAKVRELLAD
ncbi:MAG: response regulator [Candidatus Krumholzibacteriia bacterium]|nr:response regulator [bacterium]MCB9514902.1 response regulator [Candidatus Latescibacterota bacterium]